ncbi:hypothetical protein [Salidesulfovibrio brasiliensis]|uniref:hypothetical protein n=1 Tax=Salidesulfovibrio brasiliensis TaxID=221711 RepID=UPI000B134B61|nr:hypothetical protein [Salidesulfovibrio brasiliensis]
MKRITELVESAAALPRPAAAPAGSPESLADALTARMLAEPAIDRLVPKDKREMMQTNHVNHFRYMDSLAGIYSPDSFVQTVVWAMSAYRAHGFAIGYWDRMLRHCLDVLKENSPAAHDGIAAQYRWILEHLGDLEPLTAPESEKENAV